MPNGDHEPTGAVSEASGAAAAQAAVHEDGVVSTGALHWGRSALRIAAVLALAGAAWLVLWGPVTKECRTVSTTSIAKAAKSEELAKSCEFQRPTVLQVLPLIGLAGVLLLGELSELTIPGLLTMKTRLNEQQARQERLERDLAEVRITASQNQSVVNQNYLPHPLYQNPAEANRSAHAKADGRAPKVGGNGSSVVSSRELAGLKYSVLESYEGIAPYVLIAQDVRRMDPELAYRRLPLPYREVLQGMSPMHLEELVQWYRRFRPEIESVRAVRNSVAHPPALVNAQDLQATLETLGTLRSELVKRGLEVPLLASVDVDADADADADS